MKKNRKELTVLLAEDDSLMAEIAAFIMTEMGYQVLAVANGTKAVATYREKGPDLVIMDINMPVMNGLDALRQILHDDPNAKVIMLTGVDETAVAESCIMAGAIDYIQKGLGADAFRKGLEKAVRKIPK